MTLNEGIILYIAVQINIIIVLYRLSKIEEKIDKIESMVEE